MTSVEIIKKHGAKEACLELLEKVRWENGIICPYCGSEKISIKVEKKQTKRHQCQSCEKSFTVTVGTIFHKAHKLPEWFMILGLMLNAKKSKSSCEISRDTGMRQASVWAIMQKIRKAMNTRESTLLKGLVEMGETYIGGKPRFKGTSKRGRGTDKTPVVGMIERSGKVRTEVVDKNKESMNFKTLKRIFDNNVDKIKSVLVTDEYMGYSPMAIADVDHAVINHSITYVDGPIHTNSIEGFGHWLKEHGMAHTTTIANQIRIFTSVKLLMFLITGKILTCLWIP